MVPPNGVFLKSITSARSTREAKKLSTKSGRGLTMGRLKPISSINKARGPYQSAGFKVSRNGLFLETHHHLTSAAGVKKSERIEMRKRWKNRGRGGAARAVFVAVNDRESRGGFPPADRTMAIMRFRVMQGSWASSSHVRAKEPYLFMYLRLHRCGGIYATVNHNRGSPTFFLGPAGRFDELVI